MTSTAGHATAAGGADAAGGPDTGGPDARGTDTRGTDAAGPTAPGGYSHRQIMVILSGLLLGMFLAALDQTVVSTAIYRIGESLHGLTAQAWVTTAFLITSTIATPLYGKLSDLYGRKPFFLFAIAVFITGSALCTFSTSMYMLAAFRAVQGIGAGGLFSLALAIVGDIIPPRERAKYQGYFMAVFGTSSVLGPVVGGALAGQKTLLGVDGWRWIFLINVPIGIVALVVVARVLHISHERREHRIDYLGALTLVVALVPLLIVAEQGREWGWGAGSSLGCYAVGLVGIVAFVLAERHAQDDALLPPRLFRNGVFAVGSAQSAIIGIGMFGGITLIPLYLQLVKGNSPTKAGLLTLPLVLGIMSLSLVAGQITARTGRYKILPVIGSALLVVGMLLLWRLSADSSLVYVDLAMFVVGAGLGLNMQTIVLAMQNAVPPRDIGVATSSTTFFRQLGGTLGVAVFLSIVYSIVGSRITSAYTDARGTAAFDAAARSHPDQLKVLGSASSGGSGSLNDTSFLSGLDPALTHPFKVGFTNAITLAFLVGAAVLVIAFVLSLLLKEVPLRETGAAFADQPNAPGAASPGPGTPAVDDAAAPVPSADPAGQEAPQVEAAAAQETTAGNP
ncbi:MFS transporter [Frankia sp. AiPs1]|uniref:MDR family MFS transporter n=1 Tax=Frankia sp. AiPs1 TaxID=573493 RepID=UPI00204420D2|nr:MDR family MFS transporter [Frankia sp. AiPs1]MCM3921680.1 MFS transporter [Frankia sp. AiPs1]